MSDKPALLLEVNNLQTHFILDEGTVRAVDGVSLQVRRGQTLGVLGESGCGKSVTGYSILQLVRSPGRIVGGEIWFYQGVANGSGRPNAVSSAPALDLAACDPFGRQIREVRGAEIAMIFQEPMTSLDPVYTVGNQIGEAILHHEKVSKRTAQEMVMEMLDRVGLPQPDTLIHKYPHQLSGGMRQRVMIAMALVLRPSLLIADEPTTALDVTTEAQILELLKELQQEFGMAILFVTHDLGVIAEMAQEVIVMYLGKVVEQAEIKTLYRDPKHPYTQAMMRSVPRLGDRDRARLHTIEGMVPVPSDIPDGCPFHPRCTHAIPGVCDTREPPIIQFEKGHWARCVLYE